MADVVNKHQGHTLCLAPLPLQEINPYSATSWPPVPQCQNPHPLAPQPTRRLCLPRQLHSVGCRGRKPDSSRQLVRYRRPRHLSPHLAWPALPHFLPGSRRSRQPGGPKAAARGSGVPARRSALQQHQPAGCPERPEWQQQALLQQPGRHVLGPYSCKCSRQRRCRQRCCPSAAVGASWSCGCVCAGGAALCRLPAQPFRRPVVRPVRRRSAVRRDGSGAKERLGRVCCCVCIYGAQPAPTASASAPKCVAASDTT